MESPTSVVASVFVFLITLLLFSIFLILLYRFLRFAWTRLPTILLNLHGPDLSKIFAVLFALLFVPALPQFAWSAVRSFFEFFAAQLRKFADPGFTGLQSCRDAFEECLRETIPRLAFLLADTANGLVRSVNLPNFPVREFVLFLVIAVIAAPIFEVTRNALVQGTLRQWLAAANHWFPAAARLRFVFVCLVLFSFYLGLAALLAIPLFQDKSQPQNLTAEALARALEPNILKEEVFNQTFPARLPPLLKPSSSLAEKVGSSSDAIAFTRIAVNEYEYATNAIKQRHDEIQSNWSAMRQAALDDQTNLRDRIKYVFAAGLEIGIGRKPTGQHYSDLLSWHLATTQRTRNAMRECLNRATNFTVVANAQLEEMHGVIEAMLRDQARPVGSGRIDSATLIQTSNAFSQRAISDNYSIAMTLCSVAPDRQDNIPRRQSFADTLGPIGFWSGWLLATELMPVVIIVGLVGFSLLGATVSRAVRISEEGARRTFTTDDFILIVAGGTTAAVVVFLAAYGGLAVVGGTTGDPNPYVLFATCLIGAVYSEDVWRWARRRLLTSATTEKGKGGRQTAGATRKPAGRKARKSKTG